ncbi:MAG: hypothetical protein R3B81_07710 [bacterium]
MIVLSSPLPAQVLDVQTICTVGQACRVRVVVGDADESVLSTFHTNRVGPDMKYFPAECYGETLIEHPGLMYLDTPIVFDETGTMRAPTAADPPEARLEFSQTIAIDPRGHVTFFTGFVRGDGVPFPLRSYVWGYAPTTVQTEGAIAGPGAPSVERGPSPPDTLRGGTSMRFTIEADAQHRCHVIVDMAGPSEVGRAYTRFPANRVDGDLRYFPRTTEGGTSVAGGAAIFLVDLDVILDAKGGMRTVRDAPDAAETLNAVVAIDDRGFVTFFYGVVKNPETSYVKRFELWGYPPVTSMVESLEERKPSNAAPRSGEI